MVGWPAGPLHRLAGIIGAAVLASEEFGAPAEQSADPAE